MLRWRANASAKPYADAVRRVERAGDGIGYLEEAVKLDNCGELDYLIGKYMYLAGVNEASMDSKNKGTSLLNKSMRIFNNDNTVGHNYPAVLDFLYDFYTIFIDYNPSDDNIIHSIKGLERLVNDIPNSSDDDVTNVLMKTVNYLGGFWYDLDKFSIAKDYLEYGRKYMAGKTIHQKRNFKEYLSMLDLLTYVNMARSDLDSALSTINSAITFDNKDIASLYIRSEIYKKIGRKDDELQDLISIIGVWNKKMASKDVDRDELLIMPDVFLSSTYALLDRKDFKNAEVAMDRAIEHYEIFAESGDSFYKNRLPALRREKERIHTERISHERALQKSIAPPVQEHNYPSDGSSYSSPSGSSGSSGSSYPSGRSSSRSYRPPGPPHSTLSYQLSTPSRSPAPRSVAATRINHMRHPPHRKPPPMLRH